MRKVLLPLLIAIALPVTAQEVFSYKDNNGNTVYTNMPPDNVKAKSVEVPTTQIVSPQTERSIESGSNQSSKAQSQQVLINSVILVGIPDDGAVRANDGSFNVTVQVNSNADLSANYTYQLLLDGSPYGQQQSNQNFTLTDINRGSHTIQANVLYRGSIVASSASIPFTVQRVSTHTPQPTKIQPRK